MLFVEEQPGETSGNGTRYRFAPNDLVNLEDYEQE